MKIRRMTAAFGCLNGAEMTLTDGLNVICAPNESGKSTWCAFIRAMLYGIDSSERARAGFLPDKERYKPWSGVPMAGTMDIVSGGRAVTLCRGTKTAAAPMREFSAVYTGTEEPVPGLSGPDAGEMLVGVSGEVFRRSAFIAQGEVAVTADGDLKKRITALVSSGEEAVSYTEADERLRLWQRRRRYNRTGAIPELEKDMAAGKALLEKLSGSAAESGRLREVLEQAESDAAALTAEIAAGHEAQRRETLDRLNAARERERGCADTKAAAAETAAMRKAELESGLFGAATPDEAAKTAGEDAEKARGLLAVAGKKASLLPAVLLAALCLISLAAGALLNGYFYAAAAVFAAAAMIVRSRASAIRRNAAACAGAGAEILRKYSAQNAEDIYAAADAHARRWEAYQKAAQAEEKAAAALADAARAHEEAQRLLIQGGDSEKVQRLRRELADGESRAAGLRARLSELTGGLRALGDPMAIESGLREMEERRRRLEEEYGALELAVSLLKEADTEIRSRFSPALGRMAADYLSRLTGGRYDALTLSGDFTAKARLAGDASPRETAYLSAGTADLLYLAVRLAVVDLALPQDDPCPLILDDALVNFDQARREEAMALLGELAQKRQILLFTCH